MNWRLVKKVLQRRSTRTSAMHLQACRRYDRRMWRTGTGAFRPVDSHFVMEPRKSTDRELEDIANELRALNAAAENREAAL